MAGFRSVIFLSMQKRFSVPYLGFGIGLRSPHYQDLLHTDPPVDFLEIISETFMLPGGHSLYMLDQFREKYRIVPHGVSLSVGASDPLDWDYLRRLKLLVKRINAPWFSDHLCWSQEGGAHMHNLLPLMYTDEVASFVAEKIRIVQDFMEIPFLIENVSSYVEFQASQMQEWEFIANVAEAADCGFLLDINNVYVSARNHGFDPMTYLRYLPPERVIQYHIAGHDDRGDYILDTHDHPVREDVWSLYRCAVSLFGDVSLMLERDDNIPPLSELIEELAHARRVHLEVSPLKAVSGVSIHSLGHVVDKDYLNSEVGFSQKQAADPPKLLTELQSWMGELIRSPEPLPDLERDIPMHITAMALSATERFEVYLRDYWPRCLDSLKEDFPMLLSWLGEEKFFFWMQRYVFERPSESFTLFYLPQHLVSFLSERYTDSDKDRVVRIAAYEWAKSRAYFEKEAPVFQPECLSDTERTLMATVPLSLQPHVSLVQHPESLEHLVIFRRDHDVHESMVEPLHFLLLTQFYDSHSLSSAIAAMAAKLSAEDTDYVGRHVQSWFQENIAQGWFVHPFPTGINASYSV